MLSFFGAVVLGIIQGITEFLPVSSTGHLILASELLALPGSSFLTSFIIAIQAGSILAVLLLYGKSLLQLELDKKILTAFIPTAILGFVFYKIIKSLLGGEDSAVLVSVMLLVGGVVMIVLERWYAKRQQGGERELSALTYKDALIVGSFQALAMIPGVSRSAATVCGGLLQGLSRSAILEFSFLLAIPTMIAATGYDLYKSGSTFTGSEWEVLLVGTVISFAVSVLAIKWLLKFVRSHTFIGFGVYRVVVGLLWLSFFWLV